MIEHRGPDPIGRLARGAERLDPEALEHPSERGDEQRSPGGQFAEASAAASAPSSVSVITARAS